MSGVQYGSNQVISVLYTGPAMIMFGAELNEYSRTFGVPVIGCS